MVLRPRLSSGADTAAWLQTSGCVALHGILTGGLAIFTRALQHAVYRQPINEDNRTLERRR
jgi:hypothetical protein